MSKDSFCIGFDDVFNENRIALVLDGYLKKNNKRYDRVREYLELNRDTLLLLLREGIYVPNNVECFMMRKGKKKRILCQYSYVDEFILRCVTHALDECFDGMLCNNCYAYRKGHSVIEAVTSAKDYISAGNGYVCEVDIKDYFDCINHEMLFNLLSSYLEDMLLNLVKRFVCINVSYEGMLY